MGERTRVVRRAVVVLCACAAAVILLTGCDALVVGDAAGEDVGIEVRHAVSANATSVDLSDIAPFAWDRVYVFGAYVDQDEVERQLGFHWSDFGRRGTGPDSEGEFLIVFVEGATVAHWYQDSSGSVNYDVLAGRHFDRAHAKFRVLRDEPGGLPRLEP